MEFFLRDVYYVVFSKGYFLKGYFLRYLKYAIYRPGGIQDLYTHNFLTIYLRTMIYLYFERMQIFLSEYIVRFRTILLICLSVRPSVCL
jgi:hypothetical protein